MVSSKMHTLPDSERERLEGAKLVGPADAAERVEVENKT